MQERGRHSRPAFQRSPLAKTAVRNARRSLTLRFSYKFAAMATAVTHAFCYFSRLSIFFDLNDFNPHWNCSLAFTAANLFGKEYFLNDIAFVPYLSNELTHHSVLSFIPKIMCPRRPPHLIMLAGPLTPQTIAALRRSLPRIDIALMVVPSNSRRPAFRSASTGSPRLVCEYSAIAL